MGILRRLSQVRGRTLDAGAPRDAAAPGDAAPGGSARASYQQHIDRLKEDKGSHDEAMQEAIGGSFALYALLESSLVRHCGLGTGGYIVDVGCGSGRLAVGLRDGHEGRYLGLDIVPDLVDHARALAARPEWRFEVADGLTIPEEDGRADMVVFFSVSTHLLHEHMYRYLREARRVLRPGGHIVMSFLEFEEPMHWDTFQWCIDQPDGDQPLTMFIDRPAIRAWAQHLDLEVVGLHAGSEAFIPVDEPVEFSPDVIQEDVAMFGQSVAVLRLPE